MHMQYACILGIVVVLTGSWHKAEVYCSLLLLPLPLNILVTPAPLLHIIQAVCGLVGEIRLLYYSVNNSPQANHTDRVTAAAGEASVDLMRVEDVAWSAQGIPTAVKLGFLDRSRCSFFQVAPQLSSRGWVDLVRDPRLLRKCRAGNQTRDLWIYSHELWPLDDIGGLIVILRHC
jgi:hypothetical protein